MNNTSADSYKHVPADELRELCAFKDGTIEILQRVLTNTDAALREVQEENAKLVNRLNEI